MQKPLLKDMIKIKDIRKEPRSRKIDERVITKTIYNKNKSRYMLWSVAAVSVIFCFFAVSFLFSGAEIIVNPKIKDVILNENLSASKGSSNDGLSFDLVVIHGEEEKEVKATGEKNASEKATGIVIIYNTFNSVPQTLSIDTRLEGSNGKIYKTQNKVIVPGMDKKGIPGKVEVKIYANEAGSEYNSSSLDFKIVGFKGTSKYEKFYGRSKGDIVGGFEGKVATISETDKAVVVSDLKTALEAKLLQKALDQIPEGYILLKDATFLNINNVNDPLLIKNGTTTITLKGTLYGLLFNEQKLTKKIAENNIEKYEGEKVFLANINDLIFTLADRNNISLGEAQKINFNLSGSTKIVWELDKDKFVTELLGKSKKDFNQILSTYESIDSAKLTLVPVWKRSIPDNIKDIEININYPK